jgi:hypothetical protein
MHRDVRGHFYIYLLVIGGLLLPGGGCSFVKMPQGWVLNTGWSLEFHRMPFNVSCEKPCAAVCEPGCAPNCNPECANPPKETSQPTVAPQRVEPAPTLHKVEDGEPPEANESSGLMNLLKRRGRLGVCSTCGKLGHFQEPQPAEAATMPVIPKFHPVPAAPVFCPQSNATKPVDFQSPASKKKTSPTKKSPPPPPQPGKIPPPATQPEVIPSPPPSVHTNKPEHAPRELEIPPEPPDWVFLAPENATEVQSQSNKSSGSSARR